jgi:hypothetical protein
VPTSFRRQPYNRTPPHSPVWIRAVIGILLCDGAIRLGLYLRRELGFPEPYPRGEDRGPGTRSCRASCAAPRRRGKSRARVESMPARTARFAASALCACAAVFRRRVWASSTSALSSAWLNCIASLVRRIDDAVLRPGFAHVPPPAFQVRAPRRH